MRRRRRDATPSTPSADRLRVAILEIAASAEQAPVQEVHLAPQLVEAVLDGRPRKRQPPIRFQPVRRLGHLTLRVLDRLRLVEDERVPVARREELLVEPQERVARDRDVGGGVERALRPVVDARREPRAEPADLVQPVVHHARRGDDERPSPDCAQRLNGLPESHVVRQEPPQSRLAQEPQPRDAATLIRPKGGGEIRRKLRLAQSLESAEEGAEAGK